MRPDTTIAFRAIAPRGAKKNKTRVTVLATVNANGSDKRKLLLINRSKVPRAFRQAKVNPDNLPVVYRNNKKARMMSGLWYEYLRAFDTDMRQQNRQIILLVDNAPTHPHPNCPPQNYTGPTSPVLTNIRLEFLPPNTTAFLQPLDAGII
jgi:hypothetical protein